MLSALFWQCIMLNLIIVFGVKLIYDLQNWTYVSNLWPHNFMFWQLFCLNAIQNSKKNISLNNATIFFSKCFSRPHTSDNNDYPV